MSPSPEQMTPYQWVVMLGVLVSAAMSVEEAQARVAAYAEFLTGEFPAEAFTRASLAAVARRCRFFPAYGELCDLLSGWWREHRPAPLAIEGPARAAKPTEPAVHDLPDWIGAGRTRHMGRGAGVQGLAPVRSVAEQLAALGVRS